jgi:hypothetical protein
VADSLVARFPNMLTVIGEYGCSLLHHATALRSRMLVTWILRMCVPKQCPHKEACAPQKEA